MPMKSNTRGGAAIYLFGGFRWLAGCSNGESRDSKEIFQFSEPYVPNRQSFLLVKIKILHRSPDIHIKMFFASA